MLGPPVGYTDLLDHETMELNESEAAQTTTFYPLRPSSSGNCSRELAYALAEYHGKALYKKKVKTASEHRLLNLGGWVERHLIGMFERFVKMFSIRYKQQAVEFYRLEAANHPEMNHIVEGSLDLCMWSEKYRAVLDVKSKKDGFSNYYQTRWDETDAKLKRMASVEAISDTAYWVDDLPKFLDELNDPFFASNFLQLNGYACTEFLRSRGVDHGAIVQYNKNDSRLREVRFRPSMELFDKVKRKFEVVLNAVASDQIESAPKDFVLGSAKCAFCPYSKECWGDRDALKEMEKFFKKEPAVALASEAPELEAIFTGYESDVEHLAKSRAKEEEIIKTLVEKNIKKVKLSNGNVYDVKYYKTDDSLKLKRGKE